MEVDLIALAVPFFLLMIVLELVLDRIRGTGYFQLQDALGSLSAGAFNSTTGIFTKLVSIAIYAWVLEHAALFVMPHGWFGLSASGVLAWLVILILWDFMYYWKHRLGHEVSVFWAAHSVHHQSEEYNLTTALRQTSSDFLVGWVVYLPMFLVGAEVLTPLVLWMSAIAIVYTSLVALVQEDMKKLIAYSSVAHMGFVTMGIFAANQQGVDGAIFQMISHGFISGALFLCVGVIYDRMHTREIDAYGGLVNRMPAYALVFMFFTMANVGLPGTSGFVGEFLTLMGIFQVNTWIAVFATSGVILSAAYALWLYRRVVMGDLIKECLKTIKDMTTRERVIFAPLVAMTLLLGVYPALVLDIIGPSVSALVGNYETALATYEAATQFAAN